MNEYLYHYERKKEKLQSQLKKNTLKNSEKISLKKPTSNLFRPRNEEKNKAWLDLKEFNKILHVDPINLTAEIEGMATYEDIVRETLKFSCLPAVVPELKTITIGGAITGCGIESSSFRYGLVHETVKEADVLLGTGEIVTCTPENTYKDLFFSLPNTFCTLGYVIKAIIKLIPVKKYVKLSHLKFSDPDLFFKELERLCQANREQAVLDYIDGVIYEPNKMFIITGQFVDSAPYASDYNYMKIYYQSIYKTPEDYLTTSDYIWRWDPDWFWNSNIFYLQNPFLRFLLGKWMLSSKVYSKITHFLYKHRTLQSLFLSQKRERIIQDIAIPIAQASSFLDFFQKEIGIRPVWICPTQSYDPNAEYPFCPMERQTLYLDFGFWSSIPTDKEKGHYNREIEKQTKVLGGFKSLYSSSYYSEEKFWEIYDHVRYQQLKNKYDPNSHLKDLYQLCTKSPSP